VVGVPGGGGGDLEAVPEGDVVGGFWGVEVVVGGVDLVGEGEVEVLGAGE